MLSRNLEFGKAAEKAAAEFLKAKGYKILERNYKNKFGEIDIIALQKGVICFLEVKARHSLELGLPQEAVSGRKQRQICRVAIGYLKSNHLLEQAARFDVLGLLYVNNQPQISLITDAFELSPGLTV
ncbi:MAG: YraN family protein [Candidatus Omnitrophica bacterium CG11_big_fil_rev_8_21_14_0_20_43_6]|nr:MAG: YraN family protein [Candidatus Omnitrophica bacterium CG11_big_fil_rev_8_21_14_0_20_43_6]